MLPPRYQLPDSPSNEVIEPSPERLGEPLSHAQPAWVQIIGGREMSSPVVLITGALTGIGRAAAIVFAKEGARVVVSGRRDKQGQELVAELQALGAEAIFVRTDVRKDEDVRNLMDQAVKRFGRLDIAVNNAGTEGMRGLVTEQTAESYADTFDTNVLGVLLSMKHELRVMLPQASGSIVNISSTYGSVGAAGASVYVASKHAVEGLTKSAALEVAGTGIRVNVIAVGTTDTGMLTRFTSTDENKAALVTTVPLKRLATPEEIAHVIAFVGSANASYMTGASIPVDGGKLAH
jgi:NAD(P)-dependent dehydrogenase (short-subunit alcohol dehydrogenase family)